jgi:hypothetical protein
MSARRRVRVLPWPHLSTPLCVGIQKDASLVGLLESHRECLGKPWRGLLRIDFLLDDATTTGAERLKGLA